MMQKNYSEIVKDTQDQEKQKIRSLTGKQNRKSLVSCKACYLIGSHQKFLFLSCLKLLTVCQSGPNLKIQTENSVWSGSKFFLD